MTKKRILNRNDFLSSSKKLKRELVYLPELGGSVYIRELSGKQLLEYNEFVEKLQKESPELTPSNSLELVATLVSLVAVDENGDPLFTREDVKSLMDNSFVSLTTLANKALELSGLSKSLEEVKDNLKKAGTDSSFTN